MPDVAQIHISHTVQQLDQLLVTLGNSRSELITVDIEVIKQTGELAFGRSALCRFLDMAEDPLQGLVQVLVRSSSGSDIAEQFTGKDEEALFFNKAFSGFLCIFIRKPTLGSAAQMRS